MTTKEYIEKYQLSKGTKFNRESFINDLILDFISLLELNKADDNIKGFNNAVNALKMKFDAINNKTAGDISKMWNFIFATKIAPLREEICPKAMEQQRFKKEEYEKRKREREEFDNYWDNIIWEEINRQKRSFFEEFMRSLSVNLDTQIENRKVLGLSETGSLTKEEITSKYRELVKVHHPDKGGKQDDFVRITNAKNILLSRV